MVEGEHDDGAELRWPPQPDLRTALLYLHAQAGGDFFADVPFAWTAGELRQLGAAADVFHVHFERGDAAANAALTQALLDRLRAGGYRLVVLDQVWDPALVRRLQREVGARVVGTDPDAQWADARPDFELRHLLTHRQPLLDLVQALRHGGDLLRLPNLTVHGARGPRPSRLPDVPYPAEPQALRPFCPAVDAIVLGRPRDALGQPPPVRKSLDTNTGCPFAEPVERNPAFAGIDLSAPGVTRKGCSFCFMGGDYRALPAARTVELHLQHIAYYQQHLPRRPDGRSGLDEVVLRDQSALRYLPELVQGAIDRGLEPVGLLVPGRGDAVLRYGRELEEAARRAQGTGFWFTIHLIGFESFSQAQLDLYNKGVQVGQYAEALRQMRALHALFPDAFDLYRYGASSFILFNPWTTLEDLEANASFCRDHGLVDLAHGLTLTRLRLYPNLPLYWKARQEGLLADGPAPADKGAAYTGYSAEAAWRYRDERIAVIETLQHRLARHAQLPATVGVLEAVLRWARTRLADAVLASDAELAAEVADLETDWLALRALWRQERSQPVRDMVGDVDAEDDADVDADVQQRQQARGRTVRLGRQCNNRCRTCIGGHGEFEAQVPRLLREVEAAARAHGRVVLAGREPTLLQGLLRLVQAARAAGAQQVELVSNGRLLASPGVAQRLARAGVTDLCLKRHRLHDADEDAIAQATGAGEQLWRGVAAVQAVPGLRWTLLTVLTRGAEAELVPLVEQAAARGAQAVQVEVPAAEVDLLRLPAVRGAIEAAQATAARLGLRCAVAGF